MVFSSIAFIFFFLPLFLIIYYILPFKFKNYVLLAASLVFYAWGEPIYIVLMIIASAVDYIDGRLMEHFKDRKNIKKLCLCFSIIINLSMLGFFKYANFLVENMNYILNLHIKVPGIALPIGISFFTFQTMSYSIDVYKNEVKTEKNYFLYLTYVSMFPQLIAGPIVRFKDINRELHERHIVIEDYREGFLRFTQGLFKKILIANNIGALWEEIRIAGLTGEISTISAWLGAMAFSLQLYFDFSAYSDMAIGMGRMLGFHFLENFNYPYYSVSVTDFWRRWHISLSTWFRDYVYIPLGGNRRGRIIQLRNIFIVWALTGLWHGASWNYVLWGLYYAVLLVLEKYYLKDKLKAIPMVFRHIYSIFIHVFGFTIFVFEDTLELRVYLSHMFSLKNFIGTDFLWYTRNNLLLILISMILAFPVYPYIKNVVAKKGKTVEMIFSFSSLAFYIVFFTVSIAYLVNNTYNPFLYFRF